MPVSVFAENPHHTHEPTTVIEENIYVTEEHKYTTNINKGSSESEGVALGIAQAQHQFDFGTYSAQGSVAIGGYEDRRAVSIGFGKRMGGATGDNRMLLNGSIGIEEGKMGGGAALNWRF